MKRLCALCAVAIAWLTACAGPAPSATAVPVEALYRGAHCGAPDTEPVATWLTDAEALARAYATIRRLSASGRAKPPPIDFTHSAALLVSMGTMPTSGYALSLADEPARIATDALEITLNWQSPPRGAMVAQMLTSPCLVLRIPREGYREIRVLDHAGAIRARADRP
jgi:hypothetical protein